jgi:hypothetical protein
MKKELSIKYIYRIEYLRGYHDCGGKARGYGREVRRKRISQF